MKTYGEYINGYDPVQLEFNWSEYVSVKYEIDIRDTDLLENTHSFSKYKEDCYRSHVYLYDMTSYVILSGDTRWQN